MKATEQTELAGTGRIVTLAAYFPGLIGLDKHHVQLARPMSQYCVILHHVAWNQHQ